MHENGVALIRQARFEAKMNFLDFRWNLGCNSGVLMIAGRIARGFVLDDRRRLAGETSMKEVACKP
jgi:hypothetical protein